MQDMIWDEPELIMVYAFMGYFAVVVICMVMLSLCLASLSSADSAASLGHFSLVVAWFQPTQQSHLFFFFFFLSYPFAFTTIVVGLE